MLVNAKVTGFGQSKKFKDHLVVHVKVNEHDDVLEMDRELMKHYVCLTNFYFVELMGKQCILNIVKNPKGIEVCTDIREVK